MTSASPKQNPLASKIERAQLKRLEILSIIEATTLVLLVCVAVPAKHLFDLPMGSRLMGPAHGVAYLVYTWVAFQTVAGGGWNLRDGIRLFVVALIPFAGYSNIPFLRRKIDVLAVKQVRLP